MNFITFSRKMGTNGSEIAKRVADQLKYNFYDTEALDQAAREMGFPKDIQEIDDKVPSLIDRMFSMKPTIYLDRLNSVMYELASRGNAVFLGRGGHMLLQGTKCALHVRVVASPETRIQNLMKKNFQREEAIQAMEKSDREREAFIKYAFGVDWDQPELYDIVLNMDHLTVDLGVDLVIRLVHSEAIQVCSMNATKALEMRSLAKRIDAALIEAGLVPSKAVSFSVSVLEPGKIRLTGYAAGEGNKRKVEEALKKVSGIESIDDQMKVIDSKFSV
jgi:cytidylate kinase